MFIKYHYVWHCKKIYTHIINTPNSAQILRNIIRHLECISTVYWFHFRQLCAAGSNENLANLMPTKLPYYDWHYYYLNLWRGCILFTGDSLLGELMPFLSLYLLAFVVTLFLFGYSILYILLTTIL